MPEQKKINEAALKRGLALMRENRYPDFKKKRARQVIQAYLDGEEQKSEGALDMIHFYNCALKDL